MFDNLDKKKLNNNIDDIFAETDSNTSSSPENKINIEAEPVGLSATLNETDDQDLNNSSKKIKLKFILILFLVVIILAAIIYLVYAKIINNNNNNNQVLNDSLSSNNVITPTSTIKTDIGTIVTPENKNSELNIASTTKTETTNNITNISATVTTSDIIIATETQPIITAPVDSDGDGLIDTEETTAGTNINLIDSDFDGLSDYEELKVYNTNPLNPDTDGDGYNDGTEVRNGYNPKGTGSL